MAKKLLNKITIVGCGPGSKKYITGYAKQRIKKADAIIGSRRLLELFSDVEAEKFTINKDHTPLMSCEAPWHAGMAYAMGYMRALQLTRHD